MTVAEMIEALQKMPAHLEVWSFGICEESQQAVAVVAGEPMHVPEYKEVKARVIIDGGVL